MAEIEAWRSHAHIQREASQWVARLNADDVSQEDRDAFETWLSASAQNARIFEEVTTTWRQLNLTGELVSSVTLGQAFGASTQRAIRWSLRASRWRIALT